MAPSSTGSGHHPLKVEKRVRFPPGLLRIEFVSDLLDDMTNSQARQVSNRLS